MLMASPDTSAEIEWQAKTLRGFAHPNRLKILFMLRRHRQSVEPLARRLGVSETTILKHLAVLRARNIVAVRREGKSVLYEIARPEWDAFLTLLFAVSMRS